jgi:hypothetical protein
MFRASTCPSSGASKTAGTALGLSFDRGGSSFDVRGRFYTIFILIKYLKCINPILFKKFWTLMRQIFEYNFKPKIKYL